jgi:hypothetical protein
LRIRDLWTLAKESVSAWSSDYAPSMGAAIAFYTIFSIAPMLIIVIAVAGLVFGEETARAELMSQISDMAGQEAAVAVEGILREASRPGRGSSPWYRHGRHGGRRNHRLYRTAERAQSHLAGCRCAQRRHLAHDLVAHHRAGSGARLPACCSPWWRSAP